MKRSSDHAELAARSPRKNSESSGRTSQTEDSHRKDNPKVSSNGIITPRVISENKDYKSFKLKDNSSSNYLGVAIKKPPKDGITSLSFPLFNDQLMLATSWDKRQAYLYNVTTKEIVSSFVHHSPVLDGCFENAAVGFIGGTDGRLQRLDFNANVKSVCGKHEQGIKCVNFFESQKVPISAGWDNKMKIWDPNDNNQMAQSVLLKGKAYSMDTSGHIIAVAESDRLVEFFDSRNLSNPFARKKSPLQLSTRCIRFSPDGSTYALSSIEGRIAVESTNMTAEGLASSYKLRCHQREVDGGFESFPVNTLCFNYRDDTLLSGGGDGEVAIWNSKEGKRLHRYSGYPTSISDIAISTNGKFLAVAASYTWEQGDKQHPPDNIYIHNLEEDFKALGLASEEKEVVNSQH